MRMPARSTNLLILVALLFGATSVAYADDRGEAKAHYQSGVKLYNSGDYPGAIHEFTAAQAIAPADLNNYNLALCYDKLGDVDNGIKFYRAYLDKAPNADKRAEIEASIARLDAARVKVAPAPAPAPTPPPVPVPAPAAPAPPIPDMHGGSTGAPSTGAPVVTGDAQLDRIQSVDIGSMRDQRMGAGPTQDRNGPPVAAGTQGMNNGAPPPNANLPPQGVGTAPTAQPAPGTQADVKPADPVYKKWWFWAVVGVSAYVVYSIATEQSHDTAKTGRVEPQFGRTTPPAPSGLTLFHW